MGGHGIPLAFYPTQTPPRVGTHLFRACGSACNCRKREALVVKGRGTEFCRRAARLRRPRHRCVSSRKVRGSFAHRSTRNACWHLMRCRSRNSLRFDLISLAFFGPLFMAPGRFRPFPLPLLACSGRAKSRRGAGLVCSAWLGRHITWSLPQNQITSTAHWQWALPCSGAHQIPPRALSE